MSENNPYAAPQATVADVKLETGQPELASLMQRLGGAILDGILMMVIILPITFMVFPAVGWEQGSLVATIVGALVGVGTYLALNGYFLARDGQTIGKKVAKTKIVRSDYSKATFGRIIGLRLLPFWIISVIPYVGMVASFVNPLFVFRSSRKCLHDDIADTIVVKVE
jgi:uncharacterized RDD family membrane protein YckC